MSVRKFLLPVNSPASAEAALHAGLLLAKMWNAHLEVLHIRVDFAGNCAVGRGGPVRRHDRGDDECDGQGQHRARDGIAVDVLRRDRGGNDPGGGCGAGQNEPSACFTTITGREEELIAFHARLADLTIVPHPQAGEDVAAADALHAVLFDFGRPVLLAPVAPPVSIGKRIAIAWNGTSNAASALTSVMPFVRQAEAVCVLTSEDYSRRGPSAAEVVEYISHHGVTASIMPFRAIDRVVGAGMLAAAAKFGADLMSMGAYSSASRLRQLILGGTTRHILEHATLPVLMNR